jgi:hypothetical protein
MDVNCLQNSCAFHHTLLSLLKIKRNEWRKGKRIQGRRKEWGGEVQLNE